MRRVYVVLVNWNNWPDTLECLESLLRLDYPDFRIVVCDNGSTDQSLNHLCDWAEGRLDIVPGNLSLHGDHSVYPKPLPVSIYPLEEAEKGGRFDEVAPVIFIRAEENLGFAGANNVGLRYALAKGDADYVWILNNDTVVDPWALRHLVQRMQNHPTAGICGSTLLNYRRPHRIDALAGAIYCRLLGLAWHLGHWQRWRGGVDPEAVERRMDYVVGASMLVSRSFIESVGMMDETYFLYYEELDWVRRSQGAFALAYAPASVVYHKIGGSIGTSSHPGSKSLTCDFYTVRNRLKFTRKYHPWALPGIYIGLLVAVVVRLLFGHWRRALMILRLIADPDLTFDKFVAA